jgi:hypothetical protein
MAQPLDLSGRSPADPRRRDRQCLEGILSPERCKRRYPMRRHSVLVLVLCTPFTISCLQTLDDRAASGSGPAGLALDLPSISPMVRRPTTPASRPDGKRCPSARRAAPNATGAGDREPARGNRRLTSCSTTLSSRPSDRPTYPMCTILRMACRSWRRAILAIRGSTSASSPSRCRRCCRSASSSRRAHRSATCPSSRRESPPAPGSGADPALTDAAVEVSITM